MWNTKEPKRPLSNFKEIRVILVFLFLLHLFEVLLSAVRPRKHKLSPGLKSKRNLYKTTSAVSSFKYANGIDSNGVKEYPNYKKKWSQFRSSKQFHPIFYISTEKMHANG